MAARAVEYHPFTGPVGNPFAMCPAKPVPLLPEVALPAELIAVIEVDFPALLIFQIIPFLGMMTINTGQPLPFGTMCKSNIAVSQLKALCRGDRFTRVTPATPVALDRPLAGQDPKQSPLILFPGQYRFLGNLPRQGNCPGIKALVSILYFIHKRTLTGGRIGRKTASHDEQEKTDSV